MRTLTQLANSNIKRIVFKKSLLASFQKSLEEGRKLEYFKRELLKILDKQEKEEESENEVSKALIVNELYKAMVNPLYASVLEKAHREHLVPKRITTTNKKTGKTYTTTVYINPNKQYGLKKYSEQDSRGAKTAIGRLKSSIQKCKNPEDLMQIVLRNKGRFSDENGKPLPIVYELRDFIDKKNGELDKEESAKPKKLSHTGKLRKALKENLKPLFGLHTNKRTGIKANLSGDSVNKMGSEKAIEKSKANGFTVDEHFEVANKIVELYENADLTETSPDKNGSENLKSIKRFDSEVVLKSGKKALAHITVKEAVVEGHKIYSVEVMNLEQKKTANETSAAGGEAESSAPTSTQNIPTKPDSVKENVKMDSKDFPEQFNKGKWKKQTKMLVNFMNSTNGDSTVKSLYKKLGSIINNLPFKIAKPKDFKNGSFTVACDRMTMNPKEQTLQLLEISDENEDVKRDTCIKALHEIMHMIDFSCRDNKSSPDFLSNSDKGIANAINNAKINDEEINELDEHFKDFRAQESKIILSLNEKARKIKELNKQYNNNEITSYGEYIEKYREIEAPYESEKKKITELRAKYIDMATYADILDALSGGELHDDKNFYGHGKSYYRKESNKANEIVANYAALLASGSEYAERLKKNYPELAESVYNLYKSMSER